MAGLAFPTCAGVIVVEPNREVLDQAMKRYSVFVPEGPARGDLFGRKDVEEQAQMGAKAIRVRSEVRRSPHRHRELREHVTSGRYRERLAGQRSLSG